MPLSTAHTHPPPPYLVRVSSIVLMAAGRHLAQQGADNAVIIAQYTILAYIIDAEIDISIKEGV